MATSCIYLDIKLDNLHPIDEDEVSILDTIAPKLLSSGLQIIINNSYNSDPIIQQKFPAATLVKDNAILNNYQYIFNVTLDKKFTIYDLYALMFNQASINACLAVLQNTDFNFICCYYMRNKDIKDFSAFACTKEYLLHSQPIKPFKKSVNANHYPKIDTIINNISKFDPDSNKIFTNKIKSKNIEVSVIIPVYNRGSYIQQCLDSVGRSYFNKKYELIIVNDNSTDDTQLICEKFVKEADFPAKVINKSVNTHVSHSRNVGIDQAAGKYLFFLDSDNYITHDCLQIHYDVMEADSSIAACYAPIQKFTIKDNEIKHLDLISHQPFDYSKMIKGNYIDTMAMVKKSDLIEAGKYATWILHFGFGFEDYELWMRMHKLNKKIEFIDVEPTGYYRMHDSNLVLECVSDGSQVGKIVSYNY